MQKAANLPRGLAFVLTPDGRNTPACPRARETEEAPACVLRTSFAALSFAAAVISVASPMSSAAPRLLIVRRRYLGDVVLLGSLLRNLRLHWPAAQLAVLVEPAYAPVLALNPDVNAALLLPRRIGEWPAFLRRLRRARFTHTIDLDNTEKTAVVSRLSGAAVRVGLHHGIHRLKLGRAYTHVVHDPTAVHEVSPITDYFLKALQPLGVPLATREIRLVPPESELAAVRQRVGAAGRVLLVHPGSRSRWRIWPLENFARVCDRAQDELGAQVVLVGGPAERPLVDEIRRHAKTHLLAFDDAPPLPRFAALARASSAFLCHDSGPMHVAAAVGARVVALYGSQNAALFQPVGAGHTILQPPLPCTACVAPQACQRDDSYHNYCVRNISVDRVFAAVREALAGAGPRLTSETQ